MPVLSARVFKPNQPTFETLCPLASEELAVPVLGTRVFISQEPRGSEVDEALVVRSFGGEKSLHSSTPTSLVRRAIA